MGYIKDQLSVKGRKHYYTIKHNSLRFDLQWNNNYRKTHKMKKRTIIIIVIGGLVLIAALWGASRHFGWFEGEVSEQEPVDTFVYDENVPVDLENKTKVLDLVVLDMSGSMIPLCTSVVDGFNTLLEGLKQANAKYSGTQEHYLTLCLFNSMFAGFVYYNAPIDSVKPLSVDIYRPHAGTPLYDAVGMSVAHLMDITDTLSEYSVLVTIITDGCENASQFYTKGMVSRMIKMLSDSGWSFAYFGSGEEMLHEAESINIDSVYYFEYSDTGVNNMLRMDESSRVSKYRAIDSIRRRNNQ